MDRKDWALIGSAGEHYVLYQLLRRNLLAALAPRNAWAADIIVFSPRMTTGALVQVKTRIIPAHDRLFYAFLDLEPSVPETFIVPCHVVQEALLSSYNVWMATPGRHGQTHQDNSLRRIRPTSPFPVPGFPDGWLEEYRERWDYLEHESSDLAAQP